MKPLFSELDEHLSLHREKHASAQGHSNQDKENVGRAVIEERLGLGHVKQMKDLKHAPNILFKCQIKIHNQAGIPNSQP